MGTPMVLAISKMKAEPAMALAMPPPGSPTGFGVCVRKSQLIEPMPLYTRYPKTAPSGSRTRMTAVAAAKVAKEFTPRRHRLMGAAAKSEEAVVSGMASRHSPPRYRPRSEEHTSELHAH